MVLNTLVAGVAKEGRAGSSAVLLEATDLPIISDTDCVASGVEVMWKISPDMLCAGGRWARTLARMELCDNV